MGIGKPGPAIIVPAEIPPPVGVKELQNILALLNNAEEYLNEKYLAKMEEARKAANKQIALVGKAKDILRLHAEAETARKEADEYVVKAREEADAYTVKTMVDVDRAEAEAQDALDLWEAELNTRKAELITAEDAANAEMHASIRAQKQADEEREKAEALMSDAHNEMDGAQAMRADFEARLARMQELSG